MCSDGQAFHSCIKIKNWLTVAVELNFQVKTFEARPLNQHKVMHETFWSLMEINFRRSLKLLNNWELLPKSSISYSPGSVIVRIATNAVFRIESVATAAAAYSITDNNNNNNSNNLKSVRERPASHHPSTSWSSIEGGSSPMRRTPETSHQESYTCLRLLWPTGDQLVPARSGDNPHKC